MADAVIFIGIPASGKSTFYREMFFATHVRINLDMLRTRHREKLLIQACLQGKQSFVVDNTNATPLARARYIPAARKAGFIIIGYYFRSIVAECLERNRLRQERERIPEKGVTGLASRLERPTYAEGFHELWYVRMDGKGGFLIQQWVEEEPHPHPIPPLEREGGLAF